MTEQFVALIAVDVDGEWHRVGNGAHSGECADAWRDAADCDLEGVTGVAGIYLYSIEWNPERTVPFRVCDVLLKMLAGEE